MKERMIFITAAAAVLPVISGCGLWGGKDAPAMGQKPVAEDILIDATTIVNWDKDDVVLENIPGRMRARIQSEKDNHGSFGTTLVNKGRAYMQVEMGAYEYAIVDPSCINATSGEKFCKLYSGSNTVLLPESAKGSFKFSVEGFKDNLAKTGPWFDLSSIRFTDAPVNAPVVTVAGGKKVISVGSKLDICFKSDAPVAGDVQVRFVIGPNFVDYRFSGERFVTLKAVGNNVFRGSVVVDGDALAFSSKASPDYFISAMAVVNGRNCYFKLPYKVEVATAKAADLKQAALGEIHVRDQRELWNKFTAGKNLAIGAKYTLTPMPDYALTTNDGDLTDLTDGKLTARIDDKLWWDKGCVGWYIGSGHVYIKVDLGGEQPVEKAVIRLLGGTNGNFKFPGRINAFISKDGKFFYRTAAMQKLAPCESAQCDWKRYYYLNEERSIPDTRVYPFQLSVNADARYLIIEIVGTTGAVFTDELAVIKAEKKSADFNAAYSEEGKEIPMEGLIIRPRVPEIAVMAGLPAPQVLEITDMRQGRDPKAPAGEMVIELPKGAKIINDNIFRSQALPSGATRYTYTLNKGIKLGKTVNSAAMYIDAGKDASGMVSIYGVSDGIEQFKTVVPLKVVAAPEIKPFNKLHISLSWMGEASGRAWPDFLKNWRRLGFNVVSTFPRYWHSAKSIENGRIYVDAAHKAGYKTIMNDSCFHEMARGKDAGHEIYCQIEGVKHKWLCPTYRGEFYKKEMERITRCVRNGKPDYVFYDIEIWHNTAKSVPLCSRCRPIFEKSGLDMDEFLYGLGTETMRDVKEAIRKGAEEIGIPMPVVASYNRHAASPKYGIEKWDYIYPKYFDMAQPSLYVCGRAQDVHDCIRKNYEILGNKKIVPWLTAGTYGEFESYKMEQMVLEALMNGAGGITYFSYGDFCDSPLDFYYHAKALEAIRPYEDLVVDGKVVPVEGDNEDMTYSMLLDGKELLLLVGNYRGADPKVTVKLPFSASYVRDARAAVDIDFKGDKFSFEVPKNEVRLFYIK